jgi:enolase-phosphatase E1
LFSVYPDVTKFFDKLVSQGKKIYIYSSGSIKAQQLLFAHTNHGDMTKVFS